MDFPEINITFASNYNKTYDKENHTSAYESMEKAKEGSSSYYGCIMGGYQPTDAFCQHFRFSLPKEPRHVHTADMDCDGMADIVVFYENGYSVFFNDGTWLDSISPSNLLVTTPIQPGPSAHTNTLDAANVWQLEMEIMLFE